MNDLFPPGLYWLPINLPDVLVVQVLDEHNHINRGIYNNTVPAMTMQIIQKTGARYAKIGQIHSAYDIKYLVPLAEPNDILKDLL